TTALYAAHQWTHWHPLLQGVAALAASLLLAAIIHRFVEKPCARLRKQLSRIGAPPTAAAAPAADGGAPAGAPVSGSRLLARNVLVPLATQPRSWAVTFVVTLSLPRYVGDTGLGKLAFATSFVAIFGVLVPLGTSNVLVKEVARDRDRAGELLAAAFLLRFPL